jgi:hypothetical protein
MKIINYALFFASGSVKKYLYEKGVDPDTVYLNDYKFMKKVFHILVRWNFINSIIRPQSSVTEQISLSSSFLNLVLLNKKCLFAVTLSIL